MRTSRGRKKNVAMSVMTEERRIVRYKDDGRSF